MTAVRDTWVSQNIEHDADAMGAIISKAAGCSSGAIIAGMQRSHLQGALQREESLPALASNVVAHIETELAALQRLLPNIQLPAPLCSSKQLQAVQQATSRQLMRQPLQVQQQVAAIMLRLQQLIGEQLFVLRDPIEEKTSSHPHWIERVKRVRQVLADLQYEPGAQLPQCLHDSSAVMKLYQSSGEWAVDKAVDMLKSEPWNKSPATFLPDVQASLYRWFQLVGVRTMSVRGLSAVAGLGDLQDFDDAAKLVAWGQAAKYNPRICYMTECLKEAVSIL